jgi:hydroxymethylpyrimidine pyrophosphatase-like HAD family hydrolase
MAEQAPGIPRAVAVDCDGTLADGQVAPGTLAALDEVGARQVRVFLVTGRITNEPGAVFGGW